MVRFLIAGLVVMGTAFIALGLVLVFSRSGGNGDNLCDRPLPTLGSGQVTQEQFDMADAGLDQVIGLASGGNMDAAQAVFSSQVHDFTHDVDGPLRDDNEALARRLCNIVVQIEAEFASGGGATTIAAEAEVIRDLLRQAAAELSPDR